MTAKKRGIWVFGDYRNYFQNRVTLQLLSRAKELAAKINAEVCAVVFGYKTDEWMGDVLSLNPTFCGVVGEYIAHGADKVYLTDHPRLATYSMETYALLMERLARREKPEIILIGATTFGREFAPRVANRLGTGLTADCIGLDINEEGLLVQTAPSFGGNLVAQIVTAERRPQMATVRPGTFPEIPHDQTRTGKVVQVPLPKDLPADRVRLLSSERCPPRERKIEDANVVVCGGRGMGSKKKFARLFELAELLGVGPRDVVFTPLPLFHVGAQIVAMMPALWSGRPIVVAEGFSVRTFWDTVRRHRCTMLHYLGTLLNVFCCSERQALDWEKKLSELLGAKEIQIREYSRIYHK